ncbi:hypothetical protein ID866_13201 [Astraeus odoratus]|nr:hypothetical protein ID866_13201 [Astraeus odoratus]
MYTWHVAMLYAFLSQVYTALMRFGGPMRIYSGPNDG